jgi:hypothetical protein
MTVLTTVAIASAYVGFNINVTAKEQVAQNSQPSSLVATKPSNLNRDSTQTPAIQNNGALTSMNNEITNESRLEIHPVPKTFQALSDNLPFEFTIGTEPAEAINYGQLIYKGFKVLVPVGGVYTVEKTFDWILGMGKYKNVNFIVADELPMEWDEASKLCDRKYGRLTWENNLKVCKFR